MMLLQKICLNENMSKYAWFIVFLNIFLENVAKDFVIRIGATCGVLYQYSY